MTSFPAISSEIFVLPTSLISADGYCLRVADNLPTLKKIIRDSSMPNYAKLYFEKLLDAYGVDWHLELFECEDRSGSGSNTLSIDVFDGLDKEAASDFQKTITDFLKRVAEHEAIHGKPPADPLEGYSEFIEGLEYGDWEDDFEDIKSFSIDILDAWHNERVDFYRSIKSMKLAQAREASYKDIEAIDLGGEEEACRTCGVYFFDNLDRHRGVESLYCSIDCQTKAELSCVQCQNDFTVGKATKLLRLLKLSGFCSLECNTEFRHSRDADTKYRGAMRQKAKAFGVEFEEEITRRLVFERADGVCYLCKSKTHFENSEGYSPLLATVDHVTPWTKGGTHTWGNVELCCLRCNIKKKNR
jgi:5-methylcytosine-specific restriction endonuclease McrA